MEGGVAEFSDQIVSYLERKRLLDCIVSLVPQPKNPKSTNVYALRTESGGWRKKGDMLGDSISLLRRFNTLWFHFGIWFNFQKALRHLRRERMSVRVVLTFTNTRYARLLIAFCIKHDIPYIPLFHGQDMLRLAKQGQVPWLNHIVGKAEQVLFNSHATRSLAASLLTFDEARTYILYPGLSFENLECLGRCVPQVVQQKLRDAGPECLVITSVCRLVRRKGMHLLVDALMRVKDEVHFQCFIAGKGPELEALRRQAGSLLDDRIHFLGFLTAEQKAGLLDAAELFIMPNMSLGGTDFEGFGISFIEAAHAGIWVIGGCDGGASEAIEEGVTGSLLDADASGAVEQLVFEIRSYVIHRARFRELAAAASSRVKTRFGFEVLGDEWLASLARP